MQWFGRASTPVFHPSIEYLREGENESSLVIPDNVEKMYDEGNFNRVPLLIGITSHEGISLNAARMYFTYLFKLGRSFGWAFDFDECFCCLFSYCTKS